MTDINQLFVTLTENQLDYHLPIFARLSEEFNPYDAPDYALSAFTGAYMKKSPRIARALTLRLSDIDEPLDEKAKSSTERVRRYYKRHPEKVRKYLRDTVKERSQRNKDRQKAIKKHGKAKMKNHDVHHPNGPGNGWRLAKKDHGRDKKDGTPPETSTKKKSSPTPKKTTSPSRKPTPKKRVVRKKRATPKFHKMLKKIQQFVTYTSDKLQLLTPPKVKVIQPTDNMTSLGHFEPDTQIINIVIKGRLLADILRTVAHELVHAKQYELGQITNPAIDGATGSPIENQANAVAGILMRNYGKNNKDIYISENTIVCRYCGWKWEVEKDDKYPTYCHKCWNDTHAYITEGGAHGHLAHPFEDTDLSFDDFDEMLSRALVGDMQKEGPVVEKMDGQNIAFTIRDGKVVFARNKGHLKNRAEKALSSEELAQMFAGRGSVSDAFTLAAQDIEAAMATLSPEEIEEVFGDGRRVMSTEIIYPDTQNVIPYDKTVLVFHGTLEHDDDGEKVGVQNTQAGKIVSDAVTNANAQKQRTFGISGPRTVAISDAVTEELQTVYTKLAERMERLRDTYGLKSNATLRDYLEEWWEEQLTQIESQQGFKFTNSERQGLIARWVDNDKKFGVKNLSDDKKQWFRTFEKEELKPLLKQSTRPFEQVFLTAGVYSLKRVVEFLSANNPAMTEQLKREFAETVQAVRDTGGADRLQKLEYELARLKELGVDKVVPTEGLIFTYNGKPYKLTGAFAPVNQIMGTLKYDRSPKPVEEPSTEPSQKKDIKSVASDLEFKPTTKQAIQYTQGEDIGDASELANMQPMSFAKNTVSGLKVVTVTADGKETENVAEVGDIIMTGPSGEQYVVKAAKFDKLYTDGPNGTKIPEQSPRQVAAYTGTEEITFTAPWGQDMILKPGDYLVKDGDGYYRVAKQEYEQTYNPPGVAKSSDTSDEPKTSGRTIAIYPGRFQPYHAGHQVAYDALVQQFGKENVFIASSDKQDSIKSPFSFKEKQEIISRMFDIPSEQIVQVKNPYSPREIVDNFPENTTVIFAVGEKDAQRLGGKYFQPYNPDEPTLGYKNAGYVWVAPPPNLEINGVQISGTQLRAVMGDPEITERAKKEIFTKVYGKFDQDIFAKIVKTTEKAEEARKLTDQHGKAGSKKGKKPDAKALERAKSVLRQKVRNPDTERDILVATALKYPEDSKVRKAAEKLVQQAMQKTEQVLTENKKIDNLEVYVNVREPSEEELEYEIDEYFENEKTLEAFPDLADSSYELKDMIKTAPAEVLDIDELKALENSDVGAILEGQNKTKLLKQMISNKKDVMGLLKDIKAKKTISMPVVIKHVSGYYLLGGNTRLSVLASLGMTMPVKVLRRSKPIDSPITVYPQKDKSKVTKKKGDAKGVFDSLMKMRITNPETGNEIKIDTAMDYPKEHPAHKAARAVIRQRMRGLSNRAGIPKDSGPK
jgi:hypothetical protein